jgi:hypothetical protein
MTEAAFRTVQIGKETTFGTEVDATLVLPVDVGSAEFTLNRATEIPNEDFGGMVQAMSGRGSHGVRIATGDLSISGASFEHTPHILTMAVGTAVTSGTASPYTHTFTADFGTDTVKSYTFESKDSLQAWIATGVVVPSFTIEYDSLAAGENSMLSLSANLQAANLATGTATGGLSIPTTVQTIEGHLATINEGPAGTAYASLSALGTALVSYSLQVDDPKPLRPYGSANDYAVTRGRNKRTATVNATLALNATTDANMFDIYNVSGALPTERRWRISFAGSNDASLKIDHKLLFTDVHVEPNGRDGERLLSVTATCVYDSTLASDLQFIFTNATSSY